MDILEAPGSNLIGSDSLWRVSVSFLSLYRVVVSIRTAIRGYSDYSTDWTPGFLTRRKSGQVVKLTTHLQLVTTLGMSGVTPPLTVWIRTTLPFYLI